jgi:hypothetical protein
MESLQIARHDERLKHVELQIDKLDAKIDDLSNDINDIKLMLAEAQGKFKGAWWVMMLFGGVGGFAASMFTKFFFLVK